MTGTQIQEHKNKCSFHKPSKTAFLFMPKNSTTSIRRIADGNKNNWIKETKIDKIQYNRVCVILRDPVSRFQSALNMFLGERPFLENFITIKDNQFRTIDVHFEKQVNLISDIPRDKIDFFYMKPGVIGQVMKYYKINQKNVCENRTPENHKIITQINEAKIKQIYKEDYDLINSVTFKN